jgi:hypothetical protein
MSHALVPNPRYWLEKYYSDGDNELLIVTRSPALFSVIRYYT